MPLHDRPTRGQYRIRLTRAASAALAVAVLGVSAFGQATPASGAAPDAPALAAAATSGGLIDRHAILAAAVQPAIVAYIGSKGGHSAVSVIDRTTGATVSVNAERVFQTASIVKFDILATRLLQHQQSGTHLSANEKTLAHAMITQSDNNAASALFAMDGSDSGVTAANQTFGLKSTNVSSSWGKTRTTPHDQIRLLTAVMSPSGPLSSASRAYMLDLMSKVEPGQRWGITAAATSAATGVYVKNGWVQMSAFGNMEGDNSIGRIIEPGHDWLIATMSNYNRNDAAGEAILGNLAKLAVGGLRLAADGQ